MASEGEIQDEREGPTGGGDVEEPGVMAVPGPFEMASIQWPKRMPTTPIAHRIAMLHLLHESKLPPLECTYDELDRMSLYARVKMLVGLNQRLGIKPTLKRVVE